MFKYLKLRRENQKMREHIEDQSKMITQLLSEISRRDQKIIEQQKRLKFFGIEIDNEDYHPDVVDFPSVLKL